MHRTITWHEPKNRRNRSKHKVAFTEAAQVFDDPLAVIELDETHSRGEVRLTTIGYSRGNRLLRVTHTEILLEEYEVVAIHIISAREPENWEREIYEEVI